MLKLRSTQICLRDPQVYTIRQTYRREMDEGLLLGRAPASVQSLAPQLPVAWDLEPDSRLAMVYSEPRLWSVRALVLHRASGPVIHRGCEGADRQDLGGEEHARRDRARNCKQLHTGQGQEVWPKQEAELLMSSGYQPTLWKGAILRAPLI